MLEEFSRMTIDPRGWGRVIFLPLYTNYDIIMPYACRIKSFKNPNKSENKKKKMIIIIDGKITGKKELSLPEIILFKA